MVYANPVLAHPVAFNEEVQLHQVIRMEAMMMTTTFRAVAVQHHSDNQVIEKEQVVH
jgi:hypothetical protein